VTTVSATVARGRQTVTARLLIVWIRDAVRPGVVRQHADAVGQSLVGGQVQTVVTGSTAIQGLRDIREELTGERILSVQHAPELFIRGGRTGRVILRSHGSVRLNDIQRARSE